VTCRILGHELELGVPDEQEARETTGFGGSRVSVRLDVVRHADGSVTAGCRRA
jgi:hypothetical protein